MTGARLRVENISVAFGERRRLVGRADPLRAVDDVSFDVRDGEILGVVGESGSGKTTVARCIAGLQRYAEGTISFDNVPIGPVSERPPRLLRAIQMVFQDPRSSLNPRRTVAQCIGEAWTSFPLPGSADRREATADLLTDVGLEADLAGRYPAQLSGGQCQRVSIARALAARPSMLVCDEAVSALDVSVQAQILHLLVDLRERHGLCMVFITHDLGVVRQVADRVVVMQRGAIVEQGPVDDIFAAPEQPYTRELLGAALDLHS
ncbi:ABC transporter ATP-binding protein [Jiangella alba]|uniref:Peptide/nickel transport system ATP-binding protein n=1 Tax=Jiangella alba TaxID=561176 RepID=A0A1H5L9Z3_9ACTN|nr:ATP-binding cassette domain-containing protein [Jiangella alba]SEE73367.1 peptide/nickel transport system ATP-binding protein [Jiangella alba]